MLPFLLSPYYKEVIWGGTFMSQFKEVPAHLDHIGESWEVSALPGHESVVASGSMAGMKLSEVCAKYARELLGNEMYARFGTRFPLLVKFIDAADRLSIQVHPGADHPDAKSEMWYILDTLPDSKILLGFNTKMSPEVFATHISAGSIEQILRQDDSEPGDVFYIPSGQVHGICSGNFLLEIQQASDTTFRIHDYNRLGSDGQPRQLHYEQALGSIDFESLAPEKSHPTDDHLISSEHFHVIRRRLDGSHNEIVNNSTFTVLVCTSGNMALTCEGVTLEIPRGHTALIPADTPTTLSGTGEALLIVP